MSAEAADGVIRLAACAVNGTVPPAELAASLNPADLFAVAKRHQLASAVGMALRDAGIRDARFEEAVAKAQRKNALLDMDRAALLARLNQEGIWHMPLKGAVLQAYYPRFGMREMADNDILVDPARADDVRRIMEDLGFRTERFGHSVHDVYKKEPVSNFEIHRALFGEIHGETLRAYYRDVKARLVPDREESFGYHFTPEDFYLYLTAHAFKHYDVSGTGLRSFLDQYVFLKKQGVKLDMAYVQAEAGKLGIADFERDSRGLALRLFGGEALTGRDREMLAYVLSSGTYGTTLHMVEKRVAAFGGGRKGRLRFVAKRLFPSAETLRDYYPVVYRHRILLPFLFVYRVGKGLSVSRRKVRGELRALLRLASPTHAHNCKKESGAAKGRKSS